MCIVHSAHLDLCICLHLRMCVHANLFDALSGFRAASLSGGGKAPEAAAFFSRARLCCVGG